jgi:hypothetical protein
MRSFFKRIIDRKKEITSKYDKFREKQLEHYVDMRETEQKFNDKDKCVHMLCPPDLIKPIEECTTCRSKVCYIHGIDHALKTHEVICKINLKA